MTGDTGARMSSAAEDVSGRGPGANPAAAPSQRLVALDGVRGITIVLLVLGHTALVWPDNPVNQVPLLRGFFLGGTVTIFFVVGGYIVARNLLHLLDEGHLDPVVFYARRIVRLGVQLVPLLAILILVSAIDSTDPYTPKQNLSSAVNVLTFTFNDTLADSPLLARADLAHLWYLCVQQQVYLLLPLVLLLLHRRRSLLGLLMVVLFVLVTVNRFEVHDHRGWFDASVLTTTRSDGLFLGVALAVLEPWLRRRPRFGTLLLNVSLVAMLALVLISGEVGSRPYLGTWGVAAVLVATTLVAGITTASGPARGRRLLSWSPLCWLGRASLVIYLWHYPIMFGVGRHVTDWSRPAQLLTMLGLLVVVTVVGQRYIEEPTRRFLRDSEWLSTRPDHDVPIGAPGGTT
ncbi:MAG: acyltransferase [Marmoricola sp.]